MKSSFLILAAATLLGLAAQTVDFPFDASGQRMPAGKYEVREAGPRQSLRIVEIYSCRSFYVVGATTRSTAKTLLNFNRYGDTFVLTSITTNGTVLTVSRSRKAQEIALATGPTQTFAIALGE